MKLSEFLLSIVGLCCLLLVTVSALLLTSWAIEKVDHQPYYSLIVTDASNHDWAVDYNLTQADCERMRTTAAARCTIQPEGKI